MRETVVRRGLLILILVAVLGMLVHLRVQADVRDIRQTILEAYIVSPVIPESDYDLVEEVVATEVTKALETEGIPVTPPVDFELVPHLYGLFVSPREKITGVGGETFFGALTPERIAEIEYRGSLGDYNYWMEPFPEAGFAEKTPKYSAVVIRLGGVATDPPQVTPRDSVKTIWIVAHEWGHNYLQTYPLGLHYSTASEMRMLNEISANIIAEEITRVIARRYGWDVPVKYEGANCREELRPIRMAVDQFLAEGKIKEAEAYMEEARLQLCAESWCPRKLNQALFASCERYGEGAEGDNSLPRMIRELRGKYPTLKEFLEEIREVSSYEDLLALLEEKEIDYPEG